MTMTGVDMAAWVAANSDQLNADDLLGGPISVEVLGVRESGEGAGKGKQPIIVRISDEHRPWKPCLTMRRLLLTVWGRDTGTWVGRSLRLYRDPTISAPDGTKNAGGIRVSHVTGIDREVTVALTETRGRKRTWTVQPLSVQTADLDALLAAAGLTRSDVDRWRAAKGKGTLASPDAPGFGAWLASNPGRLEEIRALRPRENT